MNFSSVHEGIKSCKTSDGCILTNFVFFKNRDEYNG